MQAGHRRSSRCRFSHAGEATSLLQLWQEFMLDTTQWWDNRSVSFEGCTLVYVMLWLKLWLLSRFPQKHPRSPDFICKHTKEALWIESYSSRPWVKAELPTTMHCRAQWDGGGISEYGCDSCANIGAPVALPDWSADSAGMADSGRERAVEDRQTINMEQRWHKFFSDPSQWWDNRSDKRSPRSPDFRHKRTKEVLWIESWSNPPWVKAELAARIQSPGQFGDGSNCNPQHGAADGECTSSTSTITAVSERGSRVGVNKSSSGSRGDVRTPCKTGQLKEVLNTLNQRGIWEDSNTYVCRLQECIAMKDLLEGKQVHAHIIQSGFKPNIFLLNTLVNMYAKCGSVADACKVFDKMPERTAATWNIMIGGYAKHGCCREAFKMYEQMQLDGMTPDRITFISILSACANLEALEKGKEVHADIIQAKIAPDIIVETALADMYAKCGSMKDARQVFDNMAQRNVVSWNVMITGYAQHGCGRQAFDIYEQMQQQGVTPDRVTFICVLTACASLRALEMAKEVHSDIMTAGIVPDIFVETALADVYAKCGSMTDARQLFNNMAKRNAVSWNILIGGYAQHGCGREAFEVYKQMRREKVTPDQVTFICVLNACASLGALEMAKEAHADIIKARIHPDIILQTALADVYAKCGSMINARKVFDGMAERNVVSWNAMITGYAQQGLGWEALKIYEQMQREEVVPDRVTFLCVLNACAGLGALEKGKEVQVDIVKAGIASCINLETALVDMYVKCGGMMNARQVFDNMAERNVISWNAMIAGCSQHGCGREALQLFEQMQQEALKPNSITFISLLSACSHVGLVDESLHHFESMSRDHGITPTVEHFGCMVDILGRAGRLDEAAGFINKMPIEPDARVWGALLGACKIHGHVELAECAAMYLLKGDPYHTAPYVLLSNIYGAAGRWDDRAKVRKMMEDKGVRKEPGHSCIVVDNQVHTFVVEDKLHPQMEQIYAALKRLSGQMKEAGFGGG